MLRATESLIDAKPIGGGILGSGRGNLDKFITGVGNDERKPHATSADPLKQLLADLVNQDVSVLENAQQAIVEKVQISDRNELLKELDRVRELASHPNDEVRRTAIWALGRSRNLRDAELLIRALKDDNADIVVEANNALSYLSRKLNGVGVSGNPFADLAEDASSEQKDAVLARWKKDAIAGWSEWFLRVRPYEDRNDAFELQLRSEATR